MTLRGASPSLLEEAFLGLTPTLRGLGEDLNQSSNIGLVSHLRVGSGYAAVGEMLKPPSTFLPIVACLWLWPQYLGNGPLEL